MAEKRMFSMKIVDSDVFKEMPLSAQALYFHLGMNADDEGFLNNIKSIQRSILASDDDIKLLIAKKFIIPFDKSLVVITHWKVNNSIRSDRKKNTIFLEERRFLQEDANGVYSMLLAVDNQVTTTCQPSDNQVTTNRLHRLGEISIDKIRLDKGRVESPPPPNSKTYGEFQNVNLTDEEYNNLLEQLGDNAKTVINKLSLYMQSTGKEYNSHYATILSWYEKDKDKLETEQKGRLDWIDEI